MKSHPLPEIQDQRLQIISREKFIPHMAASVREIMAVLSAVTISIAIITLSVWVAGIEISNVLGASAWGIGFLFMGFALDNRGSKALAQWVTGVALLIFSLLQSSVSPDFIIVSGVVLAVWAAAAVFKCVSRELLKLSNNAHAEVLAKHVPG